MHIFFIYFYSWVEKWMGFSLGKRDDSKGTPPRVETYA